MNRSKAFRVIHFAGTLWFMLCAVYLLVIAMRSAGVSWWIIFSLSGHSALIVLLFVSMYLFAIFRGMSKSQDIEEEHPLTSTLYYRFFYVTTPFLGSLAGSLSAVGANHPWAYARATAMGTFAMTFLVWVGVDPVAGFLEMLVPSSRRHYLARMAQAKAQKEQENRKRRRLVESVMSRETENRRQWRRELHGQAERLANLMCDEVTDHVQAEQEAIDMGVYAWRMGGLSCMRELHDMALSICAEEGNGSEAVDYVSIWWDGIGSWRKGSIVAS
jgi:hypothetical protein